MAEDDSSKRKKGKTSSHSQSSSPSSAKKKPSSPPSASEDILGSPPSSPLSVESVASSIKSPVTSPVAEQVVSLFTSPVSSPIPSPVQESPAPIIPSPISSDWKPQRKQENFKLIEKMKNEKSEYLEVLELQNAQVLELQNALQRRKERIDELSAQLKSSEEEFEMLGEAMEEKAALLRERNTVLEEKNELIASLNKENERLKIKLLSAPEKKETEDVCLSARSFTEHDLISLRDDAIEVKEKQINLINANNNSLRQSIEHLEAEIGRMQFDLAQKDKQIYKLSDDRTDALDRIDTLENQVQEKEGREAAMEVATKQNTQLLQLLQQTETVTKELEEKNSELQARVSELELKHRNAVKARVEFEVQYTAESHQVSKLKKELATVRSTWEADEKALRNRLVRMEKEMSVTIEEQREELRARREKHYEMLERMQIAEEQVRGTEESTDGIKSELERTRSQNRELDARLLETRRWAQTQEVEHRKSIAKLNKDLIDARKQAKDFENQRNALSVQLYEMSGTVLKAVDKQQGAIEKAVEMQVEVERKDNQLSDMKRRMVSEGTLQGKHRMKVQMEQQTLLEQLKRLRRENSSLAIATNANFEVQADQVDSLSRRCKELEQQLTQATQAQRFRLEKIFQFLGGPCFMEENNSLSLNLDDCRLGKADYQNEETTNANLMRLAERVGNLLDQGVCVSQPVIIRLARNFFQDEHVHSGLSRIVQAHFKSSCVTIDLSGNNISADGVRALVLALGKNTKVQHVFVHRDGTIQGLNGKNVVYVIDVQGNDNTSNDEEARLLTNPAETALPQLV